eukprot:scaffold107306_cov30-Tisochrysis_lutea.AAC.9
MKTTFFAHSAAASTTTNSLHGTVGTSAAPFTSASDARKGRTSTSATPDEDLISAAKRVDHVALLKAIKMETADLSSPAFGAHTVGTTQTNAANAALPCGAP